MAEVPECTWRLPHVGESAPMSARLVSKLRKVPHLQ